MNQPYSVAGAILCAIPLVVIGLLPENLGHLPSAPLLAALLIPVIVVGIPFSIWLPHASAGFMGSHWRVPKCTLLLPRWLIWLIGTQSVGAAMAFLVLAISTDLRYGLLFVVQSLMTIALVGSARQRFARHPCTEFVIPSPFPYPLRRRM